MVTKCKKEGRNGLLIAKETLACIQCVICGKHAYCNVYSTYEEK